MAACTSCTCSGVATLPVPMAHTGSYAITTWLPAMASVGTKGRGEVSEGWWREGGQTDDDDGEGGLGLDFALKGELARTGDGFRN